jgi:hypothetical protein
MTINFKNITFDFEKRDPKYDVWQVSNGDKILGLYFTPLGVSGESYHKALYSAEKKLIALGLTELEAKAIIGKQLF